jgi:hypothetical protein
MRDVDRVEPRRAASSRVVPRRIRALRIHPSKADQNGITTTKWRRAQNSSRAKIPGITLFETKRVTENLRALIPRFAVVSAACDVSLPS